MGKKPKPLECVVREDTLGNVLAVFLIFEVITFVILAIMIIVDGGI